MARFKISEEEYNELYQQEKETKDKNISQRLRVVMLRYEGKKVREIAEAMGLHPQSVTRICARYSKEGVEEFARNKYTSHHRYLSEEEESAILERFLNEANTGKVVSIDEIRKAFKIVGQEKSCRFEDKGARPKRIYVTGALAYIRKKGRNFFRADIAFDCAA